jgi:hypothetical protein
MKEHRPRVFENRVLRRIFGPKRDEVRGKWRKLHNDELNELYCSTIQCSGDQIERNEMGRNVARMGEERRIQSFGRET